MYVDKENLYSDAQALTSAVASTNIIDHQAARGLGTGQDIYLVVIVDVALTDAGSNSTVTVTLESDDDVAFGTATTAVQTLTIPAVSAIGYMAVIKLDPGVPNERYSRLLYTPNTGDLSTGSFTAFLTTDIHKYTAYAKGYTIS